jgi:hypothetical protein
MANFILKKAILACYRSQPPSGNADPTQTPTQQPNTNSHGVSSGTSWWRTHNPLQLQQVVACHAIQRSITKRRPQRGETDSSCLRTFTMCNVLSSYIALFIVFLGIKTGAHITCSVAAVPGHQHVPGTVLHRHQHSFRLSVPGGSATKWPRRRADRSVPC